MLDQNNLRERRHSKVIGFIVAEGLAIGVLFVAGSLAVWLRSTHSAFAFPIDILTVAAAAAVAIIPIVFFAVAPILPRGN